MQFCIISLLLNNYQQPFSILRTIRWKNMNWLLWNIKIIQAFREDAEIHNSPFIANICFMSMIPFSFIWSELAIVPAFSQSEFEDSSHTLYLALDYPCCHAARAMQNNCVLNDLPFSYPILHRFSSTIELKLHYTVIMFAAAIGSAANNIKLTRGRNLNPNPNESKTWRWHEWLILFISLTAWC